MKLTEKEINTGIIIKALFENMHNGKTSYTIHPMWQEMIDYKHLFAYEAAGLLESNKNVLNLTSKGLNELNVLFQANESIPATQLIQKLHQDAENIIIHFNRFSNSNTNI